MNADGDRRDLKPLLWGLFLIALGGAFLLQRYLDVDLPHVGQLWPLVFFVIGTSHLLDRRPGSAVTMYLMGVFFFAVTLDWYGFTYRNSWPLLLVAVGAGMIVRALSGEDRRRRC